MLIGITLLPVLDRFQLTLYHINFVDCLLYNIRALEKSATFFISVLRTPAFSAIKRFIRSHSNTAVVLVVVGELYQRNIFVPGILELNHARSQYFLERLNGPL